LGERLNGIQEVSGSIPLISTNKKQQLLQESYCFLFFYPFSQNAILYRGKKQEKA
jgi:hypothetical protein